MTSPVIMCSLLRGRGRFSCVCECTQSLSSLWARENPFWRWLLDLLNVIHLYYRSKTGCVCSGWSRLWTDLWLLPALVFLNEMFSRSVLQNGVGGSSPVMTMPHVKALGVFVWVCVSKMVGYWWGKLPVVACLGSVVCKESCKPQEVNLYQMKKLEVFI